VTRFLGLDNWQTRIGWTSGSRLWWNTARNPHVNALPLPWGLQAPSITMKRLAFAKVHPTFGIEVPPNV